MELTTKEVNEVIDKVLPLLKENSSRVNFELMMQKRIREISPSAQNQLTRFDRILVDKNLIIRVDKNTRQLTEYGKQVIEQGGWLKHLRDVEDDEKLDRSIKRLTFEQLKLDIRQMKYWFWILLLTALAGGLFGVAFQYFYDQIKEQ